MSLDEQVAVADPIQEELERNRQAKAKAEAEEDARVLETSRVSAEIREEFEASEQGAVRRETEEAERLMRLPTLQTLKQLGSVVGDPTKGPSS